MRQLAALFCCALMACTANAKKNQNPKVLLETNLGNVEITLFASKAPVSVKNFLSYVDEGFYTNLIFHRVIPKFMIQGGGFTSDLKRKSPKGPIKNEAANGLKNIRGTLAMARTSNPQSATSQFFINLIDNAYLDHRDTTAGGMGYCVFAEVTKGMDIIDKIGAVKTHCPSQLRSPCTAQLPPGMRDVPQQAVIIKKASRI